MKLMPTLFLVILFYIWNDGLVVAVMPKYIHVREDRI